MRPVLLLALAALPALAAGAAATTEPPLSCTTVYEYGVEAFAPYPDELPTRACVHPWSRTVTFDRGAVGNVTVAGGPWTLP